MCCLCGAVSGFSLSFRLSTRPRAAHTAARRSSPTRDTCATTLSLIHSLSRPVRMFTLSPLHSRLLLSRTAYSSHRHLPPPRRRRSSSPPSSRDANVLPLSVSRLLDEPERLRRRALLDRRRLNACVTPKHLCAVPMSSGRNVVVMNCVVPSSFFFPPPLPPPSASAASAAAASADVWHCLATMAASAARVGRV